MRAPYGCYQRVLYTGDNLNNKVWLIDQAEHFALLSLFIAPLNTFDITIPSRLQVVYIPFIANESCNVKGLGRKGLLL